MRDASRWKSWLVAGALGVLLGLYGGGRRGVAQTVDETGRPDSMLVYATDLEQHPELYARADQILVFGMESDRNIGRFRVSKGVHRFCLEGGAGFFTQIVLLTDRGSTWPVTAADEGCVQAKLPAGIISVLLQHGDGVRPGAGVTATVRVDPPVLAPLGSTPGVDASSSPLSGYWFVQDTQLNPPGTFGLPLTGYGAAVFQSVSSQEQVNPPFVRFPAADGCYTSAFLPDAQGRYAWLWTSWSQFLEYDAFERPGKCAPIYNPAVRALFHQGGYRFKVFLGDFFNGSARGMSYHELYPGYYWLIPSADGKKADTLQVIFRYFEDGTQIGELEPGEVALYEQCDYKGKAIVMAPLLGSGQVSPPYDLRQLTNRYLSLNGTLKSVRLSKGVGLYWGSDLDHVDAGLIKSNACLSSSPQNNLYVEPAGNVLMAANSVLPKECTQCDFTGVLLQNSTGPFNFRQWNLTGARFEGMDINNVDFSGATLTNAKFTNASLNYVRFSGVQATAGSVELSGALLYKDTFSLTGLGQFQFSNAHLCGTSLHGAGPNQILDLTIAPFQNARVQMGGDCATDLSGNATDLSYSNFNLDVAALAERGPNWGAVNLTGATLNSPVGTVLSSEQAPLQLGKARLTGVSMNGLVLDYVQGLAGQDLTGAQLVGASLQNTNLQSARLYDANLQRSNFKDADLTNAYLTHAPFRMTGGAQLQGAYLFNVKLTQAQLSGADFSRASLYGPSATIASAIMDDANFTDAYLYGLNLSSTQGQGVDFSGAFLVGATFSGASFNDSGNRHSSFSGAYLQGANFTNLTLGPTTTFDGAFFDFTGNTITYPLPNHTGFAGYWGAAKKPVCVSMAYNASTTPIPTLVAENVCPDGTPAGSGCGLAGGPHWNSEFTLPAGFEYASQPTYPPTAAPTLACTPDFEWLFGFAAGQQPKKTTGEQR